LEIRKHTSYNFKSIQKQTPKYENATLNKETHTIQSKTYIPYTNSNLFYEINYNHNSIQQTQNYNFKTHTIKIFRNKHSHNHSHIYMQFEIKKHTKYKCKQTYNIQILLNSQRTISNN